MVWHLGGAEEGGDLYCRYCCFARYCRRDGDGGFKARPLVHPPITPPITHPPLFEPPRLRSKGQTSRPQPVVCILSRLPPFLFLFGFAPFFFLSFCSFFCLVGR